MFVKKFGHYHSMILLFLFYFPGIWSKMFFAGKSEGAETKALL